MASTTFINGTIIQPAWLNDVNEAAYDGGWHHYSVKTFGAVGDGVADDTDAVLAVLQSGADVVYFPVGTYLVNNLTIPNNTVRMIGEGRNQTIIKAITGIDDSTALIASINYWGNSSNAAQQIIAEGITFDGSGLVQYPFVLYNQHSQIKDCGFINPTASGAALFVTGAGISGGTSLTEVNGSKVQNCYIDGSGVGLAIRVVDTNVKTNDMIWESNFITAGPSTFGALHGHTICGNTFEDEVVFNNISNGTRIFQNDFQDTVILESAISTVARFSNNSCRARVIVSFGTCNTFILDDNVFTSTADVVHNSNNASKHLIVTGGGFVTSTPLVFSPSNSVGRSTFSRVWYSTFSGLLEGSATGTTGSILKVYWAPAAPSTGTWAVGDQVINTAPTAAGTPGWVCTVAGTPGTWNARANIAA